LSTPQIFLKKARKSSFMTGVMVCNYRKIVLCVVITRFLFRITLTYDMSHIL